MTLGDLILTRSRNCGIPCKSVACIVGRWAWTIVAPHLFSRSKCDRLAREARLQQRVGGKGGRQGHVYFFVFLHTSYHIFETINYGAPQKEDCSNSATKQNSETYCRNWAHKLKLLCS